MNPESGPGIIPAKFGRYEIQSELGRGAMGVVYKAADPVLDRTVAIKTIDLSRDQDEGAEFEARFYQEAKAAASLSHANIVTVYDVGNSGDVAYMAMEFLDGSELRDLAGEGHILPVEKVVDIAAQIADGLGYAHLRGVVHRDIKPANIMILRNGQVKITDFGIARMRHAEVSTQTGMMLGSPRYMSPEVVIGKRADGRSDIFSLGIILYEMLTGAAPFSGETVSALMYQTINFVPPSPSAANPAVPQMLNFIVAKMLAKNRDERYQDARVLASDLRDCLAQLRHMNEATWPGQPAPGPAQPLPSLLDADEKSQLLAGAVQMTRVTDAHGEPPAAAPTLGISRTFDSLEATQRLAVQTGMAREFDAYAETLRVAAAAAVRAAAMVPATPAFRVVSAPPGPIEPRGPSPRGWGRLEWRIFGIGLAAAVVIAAAIIYG
ncbi:MAG: serine/threonine protein kinase [Betaproteobacteria bacterium]|nr:serine/threonine protein kinase [Betaproteobacteria bacterium]